MKNSSSVVRDNPRGLFRCAGKNSIPLNSKSGLTETKFCQHHAKLTLGFAEDFPVFAIVRFLIFTGGTPIGPDKICGPVAILATGKHLDLLDQNLVGVHRIQASMKEYRNPVFLTSQKRHLSCHGSPQGTGVLVKPFVGLEKYWLGSRFAAKITKGALK